MRLLRPINENLIPTVSAVLVVTSSASAEWAQSLQMNISRNQFGVRKVCICVYKAHSLCTWHNLVIYGAHRKISMPLFLSGWIGWKRSRLCNAEKRLSLSIGKQNKKKEKTNMSTMQSTASSSSSTDCWTHLLARFWWRGKTQLSLKRFWTATTTDKMCTKFVCQDDCSF